MKQEKLKVQDKSYVPACFSKKPIRFSKFIFYKSKPSNKAL